MDDAKGSVKLKKKILLAFIIILAVLLLLYFSLQWIEKGLDNLKQKRKDRDEYNPTQKTIIFYNPNYAEDITKDKYYMGLDRNIYYYDYSSGMKESLEEGDYEKYGEEIKFMADFVNAMIDGDAEKYNDCFANSLLEEKKEIKKERFTKQKLYNITISKFTDEKGNAVYKLDYMIYRNNGSLRTDMGSDASRPIFLTLTHKGGKCRISSIDVYTTKQIVD